MSENAPYIVSARKYRPVTFASVVGQKNLAATLKNSISSGRLAQAYLFCGPRGVGKTSCARIFARTINCTNPTPDGEACGECDSCKAISKGNSFNLIELDAASNNSVEDIRGLIDQVNIPPQQGKYKVFIIDEVHMLSSAAFNAFLKTLEEPPKYAIFILATTEKHKVIPTILSRCQIYDFKRITVDDMVEHLKYVANDRGVEADPRALAVIARKADGAMRDALSIFDQVAASCGGHISYEGTLDNLNVLDSDFYFQLTESFAKGDIPEALLIYKNIRDKGFDSLFFINGLASHVRDLMVAADPRTLPLLEVDSETSARFKEQVGKLPLQWYYAAMKILNNADYNYRTASNKQLLVEVSLIRLCQLLKPATPPFDLAEDLPSLRDIKPSAAPAGEVINHASASAPAAPAVEKTVTQENPTTSSASAAEPEKPKARKSPGRIHSFRLSDMNEDADTSPDDKLNNDFSDADFEEAWNIYMMNNQDKYIMISAMQSAKKLRKDKTNYIITVELPQLKGALENPKFKLLYFLRSHLKNDNLQFEVIVKEDENRAKRLPPQEFLKKIMTENPEMANFLKSIDAEMS